LWIIISLYCIMFYLDTLCKLQHYKGINICRELQVHPCNSSTWKFGQWEYVHSNSATVNFGHYNYVSSNSSIYVFYIRLPNIRYLYSLNENDTHNFLYVNIVLSLFHFIKNFAIIILLILMFLDLKKLFRRLAKVVWGTFFFLLKECKHCWQLIFVYGDPF
jgi:hypothetical protein